MIFGVSHVVAASAANALPPCPLGWRQEFSCVDYDVHPGKAAYLSRPRAKHDFALFRAAGAGPAAEIVSYGGTSGRRGSYHVAFGSDAVPEAMAAARSGAAPLLAWAGTADVEFLGSTDQAPSAAAIATGDLAGSTEFWAGGLGFRIIESQDDHAVLRPPALLPNWRMDVVLVAVDGLAVSDGMLDDAGWNCISLLTARLETAAERAMNHGGKTPTESLSQLVNDRFLDLQFIRGPAGEVIELLDSNSAMKGARTK